MARTILTDDQYAAALKAAGDVLSPSSRRTLVADAVTATLAAVDLLTPPPTPDPDTCTALFADPHGDWWQCADDPDHDGEDHDAGEWGWSDRDPDAIPRRSM